MSPRLACRAVLLLMVSLIPCVASAADGAVPARPPAPAALTPDLAVSFAGLALGCVDRPYPYKPERILDAAEAVHEPRIDHPAFYGCFDWHSAVHGHWMLVRLLRFFPDAPFAPRARQVLAAHLSAETMRGESAFVGKPAQALFERPYGWAWGLRLLTELRAWDDPQAAALVRNAAPFERVLADRFRAYLPKLSFPVRHGVHGNTAFALAQALDWARAVHDDALARLIAERARAFYGTDAACPAEYEPSGEDFFPPCLLEADLMRRVLPAAEFGPWLDRFLPGLRAGSLGRLGTPAVATDPADGRIVHLDGLNLARAWAMRGIASALPAGDRRAITLRAAADAHAKTGLARVATGHYEGEHWLASFAVYLLSEVGVPGR